MSPSERNRLYLICFLLVCMIGLQAYAQLGGGGGNCEECVELSSGHGCTQDSETGNEDCTPYETYCIVAGNCS